MLAGAGLAVLSAVFYNCGFVAEKWAVGRMPEIHARRSLHMVRTLFSSPLWVFGFCSLVAGLGCQVVALSLAPISVVQPVFASGIVLLLVLSRVLLHERLGRVEWIGIATVGVAVVFVGTSLDRASDTAGLAGNLPRVFGAAAPTLVAAAVAFALASRVPRRAAALFGLASGLLYGGASLAIKEASTVIERHGLLDSVPRVAASADPYMFIAFSALGLLIFQTGLQRCRVSILVPVSNVISSGYLVAVGTAIFGEHLPPDPLRLCLRVAGFVGIVAGMFVLARGEGFTVAFRAVPEELVKTGIAAAAPTPEPQLVSGGG